MHEHRAGQVRRPIRALAGIDIGKIVPAVDDDERRIVEMALERLGGDDRCFLARREIVRGLVQRAPSEETTQ